MIDLHFQWLINIQHPVLSWNRRKRISDTSIRSIKLR